MTLNWLRSLRRARCRRQCSKKPFNLLVRGRKTHGNILLKLLPGARFRRSLFESATLFLPSYLLAFGAPPRLYARLLLVLVRVNRECRRSREANLARTESLPRSRLVLLAAYDTHTKRKGASGRTCFSEAFVPRFRHVSVRHGWHLTVRLPHLENLV